LTNIDLEAEVKPCKLKKGVTAVHTTTINNQRTGGIYQIEICVKAKHRGVILNGDSSLTEHKHGIPMLRSGKKWSYPFGIQRNSKNIPDDEIETAVTLYDSTQWSETSHGSPEGAAVTFTVDIA
jgi:hypothetical protein